jgi:hypothetical protein
VERVVQAAAVERAEQAVEQVEQAVPPKDRVGFRSIPDRWLRPLRAKLCVFASSGARQIGSFHQTT